MANQGFVDRLLFRCTELSPSQKLHAYAAAMPHAPTFGDLDALQTEINGINGCTPDPKVREATLRGLWEMFQLDTYITVPDAKSTVRYIRLGD